MDSNETILFLLLASSAIPAVVIFLLSEKSYTLRNGINLLGVSLKVFFVIYLIQAITNGEEFYYSFTFLPNITFLLKVDQLSLVFATLSSILWLATTIYAIGYLHGAQNQSRFFGFFSLCVSATVGLSISGNLFTFFFFYELLTLSTFVLVFHTQTSKAKIATITYLFYTIIGGVFFLVGLVALQTLVGDFAFVSGGYLSEVSKTSPFVFQAIFIILLLGIGIKAAIFPLHGWLPSAMAAPAPVSALLHAVAVVKAGAFGIIRVVYDVYGIAFASKLGLLSVLLVVACVTIIYGSVIALRQTNIKKRLAYSTISQVSYILLGVSLFGPVGTIGGLIHLVHQGVMKITLFFCAGTFGKVYNIHNIEDLNGLGKIMPINSLSFTIGILGMIGIPTTAGFLSKYYLAMGAFQNDLLIVLGVLALSTILNALYFLPLVYKIWFLEPLKSYEKNPHSKLNLALLSVPAIFTALLTFYFGIFALSEYSALQWVNTLVEVEYLF